MESICLSLPNNDGHSVSRWSGYPFSEAYNGPCIFIFGIVALAFFSSGSNLGRIQGVTLLDLVKG
jgi:hypothetical protein